jgi:HTH-type transcriptional regulator / antitoxin HipB
MAQVRTAEDLGRAIRRARRAKHLRLRDVALAAGTGVRFISELERGKETAQLGKTLHVLEVVGVRVQVDGEGLDERA